MKATVAVDFFATDTESEQDHTLILDYFDGGGIVTAGSIFHVTTKAGATNLKRTFKPSHRGDQAIDKLQAHGQDNDFAFIIKAIPNP